MNLVQFHSEINVLLQVSMMSDIPLFIIEISNQVNHPIDRFHCHAIKKQIENYPVEKAKKL